MIPRMARTKLITRRELAVLGNASEVRSLKVKVGQKTQNWHEGHSYCIRKYKNGQHGVYLFVCI